MRQQSANPRGFGVGDGSSRSFFSTAAQGRMRRFASAALLLLTGLLAAPVAAQTATTVTITGSKPATFARVGQVLTFNVQLYTGNTPIDSLSFTSGEPVGMSGLNCPGLPADLMTRTNCTFTYTTTSMDMAMGTVRALGRWRAVRPSGATRSSSTNTLTVSYAPPRQPDAPVIGTASAGNGQATVTFNAPDFDGGWPVDGYTVTSSPGGMTATGSASPITVTGLTNGVAYRFEVTATNVIGTGASSAMSNSATPAAPQTITFANPGSQNFGTAPTLTATASSGLQVSFSSATTGVCTSTSGGVLTFMSAGTCTINADQAGNAAYAAAPQVSQSFAVNAVVPGAPTIGVATAADAEATVTFAPPGFTGGTAITGYTITSSPGGLTATGAASPITLAGLSNGTAYTFTVAATNSAGTGPASAASNSIVPSTRPVVTSVAVPPDGLYGPGEPLEFAVQWDQPVDVTGTPGIALVIGASAAEATYVSGSGTATTRFRYMVQPGQVDADGITVGALALNGGGIRNVPGRDAVPTLNSVGSTAGVWVGVNNQAPVNTVPAAQTVQENGTLQFGAALSISDPDAGSSPLRVMLTVTRGQLALSGTSGLTLVSGAPSGSASMTFEGDLISINAALNGLSYQPTPGYFGSDTLQISTDDLGHNGFGGAGTDVDAVAITVTPLDRTPPAITAIDRMDGSPTRTTGLRFSVAFSEDVAGLDASDFSLTGTGTATGAISSVTAIDAGHYTVTVDNVAGDGALRLDLNAGTNVADAAGNAAAAFTAGQAYVLDNTGPAVTNVTVPADGQYVEGQHLVFTVHFGEAVTVTGAPRLPITLNVGGGREASYTGGTGTTALTFDYTVAPGDQDLDGIAVGAALALNGGTLADVVGNAATTTLGGVGDTRGVQVGLLPQAITGFAANPAAPAYAPGGTFTVSATGGASGNPLVFASTTAAVCSVSGSTVTMLSAGTCSLTADQAGDANHEAAPQQTLHVAIGAGAQTIVFDTQSADARTFTPGGTFELSPLATASSGLPVVYSSRTAGVCSITGTTVTMHAAGTCTIAADQPGDANYTAAAQVTQSIVIGKAAQAITGFAANPAAPAYAPGATFAVSATGGASGNPVLFGSTTTAVCTVNGNTVTMQSAGRCALTANQAGDANHEAAPQQTLDIVIGTGAQTIAFGTQAGQSFTPNGTFELNPLATASSGLPVDYSSQTGGVCTIKGSTVTMISAGTCTIAADQAGDANYAAAAQVTQTIAIGKAAQAITGFAASPAAPVFAIGGTFQVSATGGASGNPLVFASATAAVCSVDGSTVTMRSAGTCSLTADQAGDANFAAAPRQTLDVVIGTGSQTLAFGAQAAQTFTPGGTFELNPLATASSGLPAAYSSQTADVCTISGATVTMRSAGSCTIAADQGGDANYTAAAQVTQTIAIGKATQAITGFAANPDAPVYAPNGTFAVSATGGASGNPLVFASATAAVCTVSGRTVTMRSAGTCSLTADQAGDANHAAAPRQTLDVVIGKATPDLTWAVDITKTYGESAFDLPLPTSTGPGAFTFTSSNAQVATVSGRTVTITGAGTAELTATQAASDNYAAASITLLLTVNERPDPTRDATVAAGLQGQVDASVRFAQAQQNNIRSRLGQLRSGRNASSNAVTLNLRGGVGQPGLSLGATEVQGTVPAMPQGWGFWTAGSVVLGERDTAGDSQGFEFRSDGISTGVDRMLGNGVMLGIAGGLGWEDTDLDDGRSSFDARQRSLAMYGLWRAESVFVDGIVGLGRLDFDLRRWSDPAAAMATAQREGDQRFASVTLGYEARGAHGTLTGYGRLDASRTTLDAYRETGLGLYDLRYSAQDIDSSAAAAGIEGRYLLRTASALIRPYWSLEWRQALQNQGEAGLNYVVMPSANDYVLGLRSYNDDTLGIGAGVDLGFDNGWSLGLQVRREQSRDVVATAFGLHVSYGHSPRLPVASQLIGGGEPGRPMSPEQP